MLEWCQSSLEHVGVCWNGVGVGVAWNGVGLVLEWLGIAWNSVGGC